MNNKELKTFASTFEEDVYKGLSNTPKSLPSKYFYDKKGDKIFQQIMEMPEYYLTKAEYHIIEQHKSSLAEIFKAENGFDLIELGAGDGKKTKVLLRELTSQHISFSYLPIDISQNSLNELKTSLLHEMPELSVIPEQGMYFDVLKRLSQYDKRRKIIMVLGSNIGNLLHDQAIDFLRNIERSMGKDDLLFMGFDQKKHPQVIIDAYSDKAGITAAFNKNLLHRMNRELQADFNEDHFLHWETYDPETGTAKSFLVAKKAIRVNIKKINLRVHFDQWETIHTEISQKYDDATVAWLAEEARLTIKESFTDRERNFKNYIFKTRNL